MEETTIVIMLKDEETGFLDQELGSYSVPERADLEHLCQEQRGCASLKLRQRA